MPELTYDEAVKKLCAAVAELCIAKHRDYGVNNLLNTPFSPDIMLAVRLNEKIARLANLVQKQEKPANESEFDSIIDIIGYSIAWLMIKEGTFELPMAEPGTKVQGPGLIKGVSLNLTKFVNDVE